jgi:magnesium chelatase accessory protein
MRASWPRAEASRFIDAAGLRWHVQVTGQGPVVLLIHGTGASAHSWRGLTSHLASRYTVVAPDLPGHGFSGPVSGRRLSLPGMAASVSALVEAMGIEPRWVVGHSAGAAILARGVLDGLLHPEALISLNGALLPFRGAAGLLFPPLAKLLFLNPLAPRLFARSAANRDRVARLIEGTGSRLDRSGIDLYARLFSSSAHVAATLGMMANWDLRRLTSDLVGLELPVLLVVGEGDRAVPPGDADRLARILPHATEVRLPGLGHLAHEEAPARVARLMLEFIDACCNELTSVNRQTDVRTDRMQTRGQPSGLTARQNSKQKRTE